ncbi:uncharacterized protein F4812DRAFT_446289 [Daldinia caldariorum]|uniref:uncharacterized protein n=1 Tax=Daldinia caldariorum TaxID=326644 RepID=UPI002008C852|nr:uncharacterized protein F4812DRAFT_446289 [Daldinia caldariorum]KAI1463479.1 hypothetical protein F4812DRAFT_446289 [Daldinia caldariorum]
MHASVRLLLGFSFLYSSLIIYLRLTCWKDPTSVFFQSERARAPSYSTYRIQQSIEHANLQGTKGHLQRNSSTPPALCIGIPSAQRQGISYLESTLGSLQHGLSAKEREDLYFVVLLAHTDLRKHQGHQQPWLANMADQMVFYSDDPARLNLARTIERKESHGVKAKFDYSIVMEECVKTRAPYLLMIEDDVVFMDGWWHRIARALEVATTKTWKAGYMDFLYLRLFYYEGLLGWNSEYWLKYMTSSSAVVAGTTCILLLMRRYVPAARLHLTRSVFLLVTLVFTPLLILLYFAAGGNCVAPRPTGVHLMPDHACCGQGLVFPRAKVSDVLLPLFHRNRWSDVPTDSFIEEYADATGDLRWALTPVVMQHVGGESSHGAYRGGGWTPVRIWNFGFEDNNPDALAAEHQLIRDGPTV